MLQSSFSNQVEVQISKRPRLMKDQTQQHAVPYEDPCAADNERGAAEHDDREVAGQGEEDEDEKEEEGKEEDKDKNENEDEDKEAGEKEGASEHDEKLPEYFAQAYEIGLALATTTGRFKMPTEFDVDALWKRLATPNLHMLAAVDDCEVRAMHEVFEEFTTLPIYRPGTTKKDSRFAHRQKTTNELQETWSDILSWRRKVEEYDDVPIKDPEKRTWLISGATTSKPTF